MNRPPVPFSSQVVTSLSPGLEHRIASWVQAHEAARHSAPAKQPTITLSRAFGCEGFPLAERLALDLQARTQAPWLIYDKALLEVVAQREHLDVAQLEHVGDVTSALETLGLGQTNQYLQLTDLDLISKHLVRLARRGGAIIVGRAGAALTHGFNNCFHFRLEASFAFRAHSIATRLGLKQADAEELVRVNTTLRDRFISQRLKVDLTEVLLYDAVFNNETHPLADISAAIVAYVTQAWARQAAQVSAP